jgi:hypothetical protein
MRNILQALEKGDGIMLESRSKFGASGFDARTDIQLPKAGSSRNLERFYKEDARNVKAHQLLNNGQSPSFKLTKENADLVVSGFAETEEQRRQKARTSDQSKRLDPPWYPAMVEHPQREAPPGELEVYYTQLVGDASNDPNRLGFHVKDGHLAVGGPGGTGRKSAAELIEEAAQKRMKDAAASGHPISHDDARIEARIQADPEVQLRYLLEYLGEEPFAPHPIEMPFGEPRPYGYQIQRHDSQSSPYPDLIEASSYYTYTSVETPQGPSLEFHREGFTARISARQTRKRWPDRRLSA